MKSYIDFELAEKKPKTSVYLVLSKSDRSVLGRILWERGWRQYVFRPSPNTIWSTGCLEEVQTFITELMDDRKKEN